MIQENLTSWLGYPVSDYALGTAIAEGTVYRFRIDWDAKASMTDLLNAFIADPAASATTAIVIGSWTGDDPETDSSDLVAFLAKASPSLPKLEAIFFGDIISEENEISWINQTDVSPLFAAYPALRHFAVRGGTDLSLGEAARLESLQSLTVQTGGMSASVLQEIFSMDLPNLENLELWLGTEDYGWDGSLIDLQPLLDGGLFPKLKHLGLRNSQIANEIAEALITSPLADRLESLDLSLGTLTDVGAAHLVNYPGLSRLWSLDLHFHYCTATGMDALRKAYPAVNLEDPQELDEYGPYVAVGE